MAEVEHKHMLWNFEDQIFNPSFLNSTLNGSHYYFLSSQICLMLTESQISASVHRSQHAITRFYLNQSQGDVSELQRWKGTITKRCFLVSKPPHSAARLSKNLHFEYLDALEAKTRR